MMEKMVVKTPTMTAMLGRKGEERAGEDGEGETETTSFWAELRERKRMKMMREEAM